MRSRSLLMIALLAPAVVTGQIVRRGGRAAAGGESPAQPKPLPPTNEQIAEDIWTRQSRSYTSQYPMLSYISAPNFDDRTASWVSYGYGYQLGYMYKENLAITADLVSSLAGGPVYMESVNLGWRFFPNRDYERKLTPFIDGRGSYHIGYETYANRVPGSLASNPQYDQNTRWTNGYGLVGGSGFYYPLWSNVELSTELLAARSRLVTLGTSSSSPSNPYTMTQYSFTIGFTYTPNLTRVLRSRTVAARKNLK